MATETGTGPHRALARAAERVAAGVGLRDALEEIAGAVAEATGAELAIVRVLDQPSGLLVARAVAPADSPAAAELAGSRSPAEVGGDGVLVLPVDAGGR